MAEDTGEVKHRKVAAECPSDRGSSTREEANTSIDSCSLNSYHLKEVSPRLCREEDVEADSAHPGDAPGPYKKETPTSLRKVGSPATDVDNTDVRLQLDALVEERQEMQAEAEELLEEIQGKEAVISQQAKEIAELKEQNTALQSQKEQAAVYARQVEDDNAAMLSEILSLKGRLTAAQEENRRMQRQIGEASDDESTGRSSTMGSPRAPEEVQERRGDEEERKGVEHEDMLDGDRRQYQDMLEEERKQYEEMLDGERKQYEDKLEEQRSRFEAEVERLQTTIRLTEEQAEAAARSVEHSEQRIVHLEGSLHSVEHELSRVREQNEQMRREGVTAQDDRIIALQIRLQDAQKTISELESRDAQHQRSLREALGKNEAMHKRLAHLQMELQRIEVMKESLDARVAEAEALLAEKHRESALLRKHNERLTWESHTAQQQTEKKEAAVGAAVSAMLEEVDAIKHHIEHDRQSDFVVTTRVRCVNCIWKMYEGLEQTMVCCRRYRKVGKAGESVYEGLLDISGMVRGLRDCCRTLVEEYFTVEEKLTRGIPAEAVNSTPRSWPSPVSPDTLHSQDAPPTSPARRLRYSREGVEETIDCPGVEHTGPADIKLERIEGQLRVAQQLIQVQAKKLQQYAARKQMCDEAVQVGGASVLKQQEVAPPVQYADFAHPPTPSSATRPSPASPGGSRTPHLAAKSHTQSASHSASNVPLTPPTSSPAPPSPELRGLDLSPSGRAEPRSSSGSPAFQPSPRPLPSRANTSEDPSPRDTVPSPAPHPTRPVTPPAGRRAGKLTGSPVSTFASSTTSSSSSSAARGTSLSPGTRRRQIAQDKEERSAQQPVRTSSPPQLSSAPRSRRMSDASKGTGYKRSGTSPNPVRRNAPPPSDRTGRSSPTTRSRLVNL